MIRARVIRFSLLAGLLSLSGCAAWNTWGTQVPMGEKKYPKVPIEHVMILFEPPQRAYEEIGLVSSLGGLLASDGDMFKKMQREAAALGADAIVVRPEKKDGSYPKTAAVAIKYK